MKRIVLFLGLLLGATSALGAYTPANPNGQATMANSTPVVIASNQSTLNVLGPLTNTELRALAVPVSGTFWQATQPVSGTFFQATQPVSIAATVAVSGPLTDTQLRASAVPVSAASLPLPAGASTETTLAALNAKITLANGTAAANESTVDRVKANAELRMLDTAQAAGSQLVAAKGDQTSGLWVNVKNSPAVTLASTTVTGSVAVTGPLTDTQLRASAVPTSLASVPTHAVTQSGSWTVTGAGGTFPVTGAVPANTTTSGTLSASDAVVAAPIGDGTLVTGASTAGSVVAAVVPDGFQAWTLLIKGYVSGTIYTEASNNSTNGTDGDWVEVKGRRTGTAPGTESVLYAMVANGYYRGNGAGFKYLRARLIGGTGPTIQWQLSNGMGATFLNSGIPAGSSTIGNVGGTGTAGVPATAVMTVQGIVSGTAIPVSGAFFQATQPISGAVTLASTTITGTVAATQSGTWNIGSITTLPALATGANVIGALTANQSVNVAQIGAVAPLMGNGVTGTGSQRVTIASDNTAFSVNAVQAALTKGTQGSNGITTQDLKDAGRNPIMCYTQIPVLSTATDTLQSMTCTKSGAAVAATTTPAVVTTGKTFRVTRVAATYIATAASGYAVVRVRFNAVGLVTSSNAIATIFAVGTSAPATANAADTIEASIPDGWEFAAGTGVGVTVQGFAAVTATAVGYVMVTYTGFEY